MAVINVILSCYNGERFLSQALDSIINQTFTDWEMIFVNDGSTDNSLEIAKEYSRRDKRIKIISKNNGGLNSARNYGMNFISKGSKAVIFSDSDDLLHKEMFKELYGALEYDSLAGAAYCNYKLINEEGNYLIRYNSNARYVPTKLGISTLDDDEKYTPFVSIYTWTPMIEPMTMLRKEVLLKYDTWDEINFPKFTYGESIPLFGEISLNYKVIYVNKELYYYRKHGNQITGSNQNMRDTFKKIDRIWENKILLIPDYKSSFYKAMIFRKYRLPLFVYCKGSFKHELRYHTFIAAKKVITYFFKYLYSLPFNLIDKR